MYIEILRYLKMYNECIRIIIGSKIVEYMVGYEESNGIKHK
jgi:hypothetical protein